MIVAKKVSTLVKVVGFQSLKGFGDDCRTN